MADPHISWYRSRAGRDGFRRQAAAFERSGISLIQPGTGSPVLLNVEGDQVRLPVDTVEELIGSALAEITLQWWFSSDTDLICCFSYEPAGWEKQHYFLDGLYPEERSRAEQVICGQALADSVKTVALVVDETGRTVESDWDEVVRGTVTRVDVLPDALLLDTRLARRLHGFPEPVARLEMGAGLTLLTTGGWTIPGEGDGSRAV